MFNKVLFIGLGGAGQRHLRIINKIMPHAELLGYRQLNKTPCLNSDFTVNTKTSITSKYDIEIYDNLDNAYANKPDLAIISTPTSLHYEHIKRASNEGCSIIVEKPGSVDKLEAIELSKILRKNDTKFLISFQRRFHPLIKKLKDIIKDIKPIDINDIKINVNSYVPSWHPYEDYNDLYACKASLGGGVLLTESHEIDFVIWLFGTPKSIQSKISSDKAYGFDVEDSAKIILEYGYFNIDINLDFMQKVTERTIKINSKLANIFLDLQVQKLVIEDKQGNIEENITDTTNDALFEEQFNYFMKSKDDKSYIASLINNLTCIDLCKELSNLY